MQRQTLFALGLLVSLGFIWGSGYSLAKIAMQNGVPPLGYSFWQSLGPALLLCLISIKHYRVLFDAKLWPFFIFCGLIGIAIPNTNMYFVAAELPAGLLSVIVNTVPILTYPLALLCRQERFKPLRFLAIFTGFIGISLLVSPKLSLAEITSHPWALMALLTPLSFAVCALFINAKRPEKTTPLTCSAGMLVCSALLLAPLVIQQQAFYPLSGEFNLAKGVILLEIALSSLGYLLFFQLIRVAGPVYYSLTGGMVALTGLFWGWFLFGETLTAYQLLPVGLILLSILLLSEQQSTR